MLIGLLLVVQVTVVVRDSLALGVAAREGAREAAVSADDARVTAAVHRSAGPLLADRIEIVVSPAAGDRRRGDPVSVSLSYVEHLRVPVVDRMVNADLLLRAAVTMRLERSYATPSPSPAPTPGPSP